MSDIIHIVGDGARPRASIPPGEAETVQRLVQKEIAGLLATHRAEIDLEYRLKRYRELASRFRALRAEEADVQEADGRIEPAAAAPPHAERGIGPPRRPTCGRHRPPIRPAPEAGGRWLFRLTADLKIGAGSAP